MAILIKDIVLQYIDETLDADDLETLGDYIRSVFTVENILEWQRQDVLRQLYKDIFESYKFENNYASKLRLKMAIEQLESEFSDYLVNKETDAFPGL